MKITITIIWAIFAVMFGTLGWLHWQSSKNSISAFPTRVRSETESKRIRELGIDIDKPFEDFVPCFNLYLNKFNASAQKENKLSACGYWAACATCFLSVFLEWRDKYKAWLNKCCRFFGRKKYKQPPRPMP